ncbi:Replication factor C (RF-C) subunit [Balamuthia mandrillaris]
MSSSSKQGGASSSSSSASSSSGDHNLPWVEKYRPKEFDEVISHAEIINTIQKLIDSGKLPHLLFYGPPGTGKTTTILACARRLYGSNYKSMILELNASDDRGIDVVREQIKNFASTRKIFSTGVKLVILDEADSMTNAAQAALRRVIEKFSKNTRFCLICNYISKIIPALQSRCTRFRFSPLDPVQIKPRLQHIIKQERINVTDDGLEALIKLAEGDMRKCLNVLQSTIMAFDVVNEKNVYLCTGNPEPEDINQLCRWLLSDEFDAAYRKLQLLKTDKGLALADIIRELHHYVVTISFPDNTKIELFDKLADLEYRVSQGASESIQMGALVGLFQQARQQVASPSSSSSSSKGK